MTGRASPVVIGRRVAQRGVGRMAREAGKRAIAFGEARAPAQIQRLMACVPGVRPIGIFAGRGRLAMAGAAELVQFGGRKALRVANWRARSGMLRARPMARLTLHSQLGGLDLESG